VNRGTENVEKSTLFVRSGQFQRAISNISKRAFFCVGYFQRVQGLLGSQKLALPRLFL
jgi:hypothetical protein